MSLILEALKKSEHQRRLGEAPTLATPVLATRRRRNLLPVLAIAIAAALGVAYWLMRTPSGSETAPAGTAPTPDTAPASTTASERPETPAREGRRRPVDPSAAERQETAQANAALIAASRERARRVAADNGAPGSVADLPVSPLTAGPRKPPGTALPASPAGKPAVPDPAPAPAAPATPPAASIKPVQPKSAAPEIPSAAPARPAARTAPAAPLVWELPYSVRKDLPPLAMTMHVYASAPADRFVVIGGERRVEGDSLDKDLVLRTIRADGIELEFKGQRFLYPRDGR